MKRVYRFFAIAVLCIVATTFSANAQIYYGVKAGANISTAKASGADADSDFGYQAGVVLGAKIPLIGIGIETEGLWVNNKMQFDDGGCITSNSIEIPVMLSVPIIPVLPISIKAGPSFVVYNNAKVEYDSGASSDLDPVKSSVGYTVGLGVNLLKFTFDLRFNGQFKSSSPFGSLENTVSSYNLKANTFSATVGYRF